MINFNSKCWEDTYSPDKVKEALAEHKKKISEDLSGDKLNKFFLGVHLIELYNSNCYANIIEEKRKLNFTTMLFEQVSGEYWGNVGSKFFFEYCENTFGLDKGTVSRLMNIVDEFGDKFIGFAEEWQAYSYSQLVELLSLTPEQRKEVKPEWTIKQIRDYKKKLVAMSQQEEESPKKSDELKKIQKRNDEYSAFKYDLVHIPLTDKTYDYTKYDKFRSMSLCSILDRLIKAEAERDEYAEDAKRYKTQYENEVAALADLSASKSKGLTAPAFLD